MNGLLFAPPSAYREQLVQNFYMGQIARSTRAAKAVPLPSSFRMNRQDPAAAARLEELLAGAVKSSWAMEPFRR